MNSCETLGFEVEFATLKQDGDSIVLEAAKASGIGLDTLNHAVEL